MSRTTKENEMTEAQAFEIYSDKLAAAKWQPTARQQRLAEADAQEWLAAKRNEIYA